MRLPLRFWCVFLLGILGFSALLVRAEVPWPQASFSYYADDVRLEKVLTDFAQSFNLSLVIGSEDGQLSSNPRVNGRFSDSSPTVFLSRLAGIYGFRWFSYAGALYIDDAASVETVVLRVPGVNVGALESALLDLGVLNPDFGWGALGEGIVLVSGPPSYVHLLQEIVGKLPAALGIALKVFPLKYATVNDRIIEFRGQQIVTPGLVAVLRNILSQDAQRPLGSGVGPALPNTEEVEAPLEAGAGQVDFSTAIVVPRIDADTRLNAVIVRDSEQRMPLYAKLIKQLDVPAKLIEIEAMIVDVNSSRLQELGISWGGRNGNEALGFGSLNNDADNVLSYGRSDAGGVSPSTLVVDSGNYLVSRVRLLQTLGDADIRSRPSILTMDNTGALLDLSETFYIRTTGERVAEVTPVTVGTTLRVTPRLIREKGVHLIQLIVDIEDGQIQDRRIDDLPTVRRSVISTQAVIREGQTLLIGGYNSTVETEEIKRFPLLGQLPLVGLLFSSKSKSSQTRERFFMIRPKFVKPREVLHSTSARDVEQQVGQKKIVQKAVRKSAQKFSAKYENMIEVDQAPSVQRATAVKPQPIRLLDPDALLWLQ